MFSYFHFWDIKTFGRQHGALVKKRTLKFQRSLFDPTHHHHYQFHLLNNVAYFSVLQSVIIKMRIILLIFEDCGDN